MSWHMPSETAPHKRTWMAFPSSGYTLGETAADADEARTTWAAVANSIIDFEPVTMVVGPGHEEVARRYLASEIEVVTAELDDAWMRDIGPTFVLGDDGRLGAVDWVFNGWGQQAWASWEHDARIGRFVAELAGAELVTSRLVNEGGGIHVDGAGTVLVTDTVQLDPLRNPGWSRADVEAELSRTLGVSNVVWIPRGLTRDSERFGTKGHVDIVATIPAEGVILLHGQAAAGHPDHEAMTGIRRALENSSTADRRPWQIVEVPAPATLSDAEGFVDFSYINHLVVNGGVIACSYDDANDEQAIGILEDAYPGRAVVTVDARPLFARGGGIHCITQHEPLAAG
ncbi:agmatine deiminase family protein [Subtercola sp. PAMC28395]|uniref:agmatine deiminase family protein n=1 Tax=Subtercola sp. PAMC28395 TaxID=2846775 RepID=UPI001C0DBB00|nr:agmatine deiminase family protein [Subtercola sp. PAMC28395]QWT23379.1 agmatine deiminase family protein [Subtercola sp. PAMC28395]